MGTIERNAARVVLLDGRDRVLLLKWVHANAPERGHWWITPGGGLDPEESYPSGAARELFEETGLRLAPDVLQGPIFERDTDTEIDGTRYFQHEVFFLARVDAHEVDTAGFSELEVRSVVEHRWWTRAELASTGDAVYPDGLAALLDRVA